jgi:hypothetical protein
MQSLQLHLTGAARSWLDTLPNESIGSWGELESQFARNFCSTYKRPASLEEVKACVQRKSEALRSYIQRWSLIKNSVEDVSDKRAIDAFSAGLRRSDLVEEIERTRPTTIAKLIEEANKFAADLAKDDGECVHTGAATIVRTQLATSISQRPFGWSPAAFGVRWMSP